MKISGFSFIRNGAALGYPFIESIQSLLPLCDEFIVAVGKSSDDTLARLHALSEPKLRIIETLWNESMQDRGFVYAQQKMIAQFNCTGDWAFYLESDEIVHERDLPLIKAAMQQHLDNPRVESLIFDYYHFYGAPDTLAVGPGWYRRAPRVIRNTIRSYSPDGLFFVVMDKNKRGRYPRAAHSGASIYHYGHVRPAAKMREKISQVSKYWGHAPAAFKDYGQIDPQTLAKFSGEHPQVIQSWLATEAAPTFTPDPDYRLNSRDRRHRWLMRLEQWLGKDLSKKHYRLLKNA